MSKVNTKAIASVKELIHDKINKSCQVLNHDLNSVRLKATSDLFNETHRMISKKAVFDTAEVNITKDTFKLLVNDYLNKTDYRIDIKAFNKDSYKTLKEICANLNFTEFDATKKKDIDLNKIENKLGIWHELINYPIMTYKMVINTGYTYKPYIVINITLEN